MPRRIKQNLRFTPSAAIWLASFVTIVLIGGSLIMDLSGQSGADQFIVSRWSIGALRIYLWLEGGLLAGVITALGVHVVSVGLSLTRGGQSSLFGISLSLHPRMPAKMGYIFVVLGSSLVALSLTTLVLLNSCRYMRLV